MVVLILAGGLGNQMFQYAAARALAMRNGTDLIVNTELGFVRDTDFKRVYALEPFNVKIRRHKLLSFNFPGGDFAEKISRRIGFHIFCPWYRYLFDKKIQSEEIINNSQKYKNVILGGYWVHQRYFEDKIDEIRNDFSIREQLPDVVQRYVDGIESFEGVTIAVGVRTYQEIKDLKARTNGFFYVRPDFYNRAMAYCAEKYRKVRFLIFTQDEEWVNDNLELEKYEHDFVHTFTEDTKAYYDMIIMSKSQHYIISNSTFYWWGAWLNPDNKKEIIVPKDWTNSTLDQWTKL